MAELARHLGTWLRRAAGVARFLPRALGLVRDAAPRWSAAWIVRKRPTNRVSKHEGEAGGHRPDELYSAGAVVAAAARSGNARFQPFGVRSARASVGQAGSAGVLIGFKSEDDWFEYRLENDPRFLARVQAARESIRSGRGVGIDDLP